MLVADIPRTRGPGCASMDLGRLPADAWVAVAQPGGGVLLTQVYLRVSRGCLALTSLSQRQPGPGACGGRKPGTHKLGRSGED